MAEGSGEIPKKDAFKTFAESGPKKKGGGNINRVRAREILKEFPDINPAVKKPGGGNWAEEAARQEARRIIRGEAAKAPPAPKK